MKTESLTLNQLRVGERLTVGTVCGEDAMKRRLEDLGVVEGTRIACLMKSPLGDPTAYLIRGAVIALRAKDAQRIVGAKVLEERESDVWE